MGVKNGNGILRIVVAYSTISLSYYTGLWYGRLGKVGLILLEMEYFWKEIFDLIILYPTYISK